MQLLSGLMIPFVGTTLGAAMVFFMRREMNRKLEMLLMGFAAGVMIAASVWSLLIPAIDMAEEQKQIAWVPATVGFVGGIAFLLVLDTLIPHWHLERDEPEGMESTLKKTTMLVLAVTLHNIPEGMSVGNDWRYRDYHGRRLCLGGGHCHPELSGRGYHIHASSQ